MVLFSHMQKAGFLMTRLNYNVLLLSSLGKYFDNETSGLHSMLLQVTKSSPNLFNEILKQGTEENYDIRVMLVGRADVGKTTLTRRLLRLPVNLKKYDSTSGVDVHIDTCDIQLDSGTWGKILGHGVRLRLLTHCMVGNFSSFFDVC